MTYLIALVVGLALSSVVYFGFGIDFNTSQVTKNINQSKIETSLSSLQNTYNKSLNYGVFMQEGEWENIYKSFDKIPDFENGVLNFYEGDFGNYFCVQYSEINKNDRLILNKLKEKRANVSLSNVCSDRESLVLDGDMYALSLNLNNYLVENKIIEDCTGVIAGDFCNGLFYVDNEMLLNLVNGLLVIANNGEEISSYADNVVNTSLVTSLSNLFFEKDVEYSIEKWDVSNVFEMNELFNGSVNFNQNLNNWNTSNLKSARGIFSKAVNFNQPLNNWDVSGVNHLVNAFNGANSFNQSLNSWDISNVVNMRRMFYNAVEFNQPLNNWDVSGVMDMSGVFQGAENFNQPLDSWSVSNVKDMSSMFWDAALFNQPLNNWDVSSVEDMKFMFYAASSFNQSLNSWNVSSVISMRSMFFNAILFDQDISKWNVENVENCFRFSNYLSEENFPDFKNCE